MGVSTSDSKRNGRSRITNGALFLSGQHSTQARRVRDLLAEWEPQVAHLNTATRLLLKRAAVLCVMLEQMDDAIAAANNDSDQLRDMLIDYTKGSGQLFRLLREVGLLHRKPPAEDAPALENYVMRKYGMTHLMGTQAASIDDDDRASTASSDDDDDESELERVIKKVERKRFKRRKHRGD